jgi:CheY-like chemotaxis protein
MNLKILLADNGLMGLRLLKIKKSFFPHLILTDQRMPIMDGINFIKQLRNKFPQVYHSSAIYLMSAFAKLPTSPMRIAGIIQKPFDLKELNLMVDNLNLPK